MDDMQARIKVSALADPELQRQIDAIGQTIKNAFGELFGVALPALSVAGFAKITDNMATRIEKLSNAGKSLNMGIGEIDKWTGAMEIAGVNADQFIGSLQNINNQIREISRGQRPAMWIEAIRGWLPSGDGYRVKNGSVRWLRDVAEMAKRNDVKNNPQVYADMAQALRKMGVDGKTAYALLNGELDKYLSRAEKLGIVTEEDEKKARSYLFAVRSVQRAWTVFQTKIMSAVAPAFEFLADCIIEVTQYTDMLVPALMALVAPQILNGLKFIASVLFNPRTLAFATMWWGITETFKKLAEILEGAGMKRLAEIVKHPITITIAGLAGIKMLSSLLGKIGIGASVLGGAVGTLTKKGGVIGGVLGGIAGATNTIAARIVNVTGAVVNVNGGLAQKFTDIFRPRNAKLPGVNTTIGGKIGNFTQGTVGKKTYSLSTIPNRVKTTSGKFVKVNKGVANAMTIPTTSAGFNATMGGGISNITKGTNTIVTGAVPRGLTGAVDKLNQSANTLIVGANTLQTGAGKIISSIGKVGKTVGVLNAAVGGYELVSQLADIKNNKQGDMLSMFLSGVSTIAPFFGPWGIAAGLLSGGAGMLYDKFKENNGGNGFNWAQIGVDGQPVNGRNLWTTPNQMPMGNTTIIYNVNGNLDSGLLQGGMPAQKSYVGGT